MTRLPLRAWITPLAAAALMIGIIWANLPACASSPVSTAQTLEQKTYALYGSFVIAEEQAAQLAQNPSTPTALKQTLARADGVAKPSADALLQGFLDYEAAAKAVRSGTSTQAQLDIAAAHLSSWITQATENVQTLITAVKSTS